MAKLLKESITQDGNRKKEYVVGFPTYIPKRRNPISDIEKTEMDAQFKMLQQKMENRRLESQGIQDIKLFNHWVDLNKNIDVSKPLSIAGSTEYLMSIPLNMDNLSKYMSMVDAIQFTITAIKGILEKNGYVPLYAKYDNTDELTENVVASLFRVSLVDGSITGYIKFNMGGNDKRRNGTMAKWLWLHPHFRSIQFAVRENDSKSMPDGKPCPIIDGMYIDGQRIRNPDCAIIYKDEENKILYGEDFTLLIQDYHQRLINAQNDLRPIEKEINRTFTYLKGYLKDTPITPESIDTFVKISGFGPLITTKIIDEFRAYRNSSANRAALIKKINRIRQNYDNLLKSYIAEEDEPYIEIFD